MFGRSRCTGVLLADDSVGILAVDAEEVVAAVVEVADAMLAVVAWAVVVAVLAEVA